MKQVDQVGTILEGMEDQEIIVIIDIREHFRLEGEISRLGNPGIVELTKACPQNWGVVNRKSPVLSQAEEKVEAALAVFCLHRIVPRHACRIMKQKHKSEKDTKGTRPYPSGEVQARIG
jgi:hypothetical protein